MASSSTSRKALDIAFSGSSSLVNELGKFCMIILRDGRHIVGMFTSFDQFGNVVVEDAYERHSAAGKYLDIPIGVYIVRSENLVLLAELDEEPAGAHPALTLASLDEVLEAEKEADKAAEARNLPSASQLWKMED